MPASAVAWLVDSSPRKTRTASAGGALRELAKPNAAGAPTALGLVPRTNLRTVPLPGSGLQVEQGAAAFHIEGRGEVLVDDLPGAAALDVALGAAHPAGLHHAVLLAAATDQAVQECHVATGVNGQLGGFENAVAGAHLHAKRSEERRVGKKYRY